VKVRLAVAIIVLAAAIAAAVFFLYPPQKPKPPGPKPLVTARPQAPPPKEVVVRYLKALQSRDCRAAYDLLSATSRQAHPYPEFVSLCEKAGSPSLDVEAATEKASHDDRASVTVPMIEDPAEAGFALVREGEAWKIVFAKGSPWFPYAE